MNDMAKKIVEIDERNIEWTEDCYCSDILTLPDNLKTIFLDKLDIFCLDKAIDDKDHYFIVFDDNSVEIIPASQYTGV